MVSTSPARESASSGPNITTLVLGAGASRSVSYAPDRSIPSFLDRDFVELLQRLCCKNERDQRAVERVIQWAVGRVGDRLWGSMERLFYTVYLRATLKESVFRESAGEAKRVLSAFKRAIQALLREAHGKETCGHHSFLVSKLQPDDAIISFNYDLVPERSLRQVHEKKVGFGPWVYGFAEPLRRRKAPVLLKLHGSVNWVERDEFPFGVKTKKWADFSRQPGYSAGGLPILLPYWDKRVEDPPWCDLWRMAARQLKQTERLIIWGYSLPLTDLKADALFRMACAAEDCPLREVFVIDPSTEAYERWRSNFVRKRCRHYSRIEDFIYDPLIWRS